MKDVYSNQIEGAEAGDELREKVNRAELVDRIARAAPSNGTVEPVKGLHLNRASVVTEPHHSVTYPSFCVIAQGSKEILLGEERYRYDPYKYLLATVELPAVSYLVEASPEKPYLSLRLDLDPAIVASVMLEARMPSPRRDVGSVRAINVSPLNSNLLDAAVRLVRLTDAPPAEGRVLLPLVTREIVFRLLAGDQGARLRHIAVLGGHTDRIARAIERLRNDFDKPLRIESLAHDLGMSASGFHEHFKAVTAMSPLQFQKNLRLQEARRLLLGEDLDAASIAYRVGYEDTSHFSREYKRHFGSPPMRDVARLRAAAKIGA
ncbi:MAG: AraC family transcriptional regulator [Capsulimonas sp.]|uniref:AraC family transcriptional regulator n=1 Tax=Capsulimonas sp. TaxID=2494211 RepID=UPI00326546AB